MTMTIKGDATDLVPRMREQGYEEEHLATRRAWVEARADCRLDNVGAGSIPGPQMRGNVENPIGVAQVPIGVAGPLVINGGHANGTFYVPLATTEGALVRSYERGMVACSRAGGISVRSYTDENRINPVFMFDDVSQAGQFSDWVSRELEAIRQVAEATTSHGKLLRLVPRALGRQVQLEFCFSTADAQGMNMIARAASEACEWILENSSARRYLIFSGASSEKRASGSLLSGGKGKKVAAGVRLPASTTQLYLHARPEEVVEVWHHTVLGHLQSGALGYNGHLANGVAALFIACGQDVANVANAAVGVTNFELTEEGDLYASVTLPSLTVATVGGGTGLGTARECLEMLGCHGSGGAPVFAEVVAATLLAGELSMAAAVASGEFVDAHETYGRNRPGNNGL